MSAALWTRVYSNKKAFALFLILIVAQAIDATIGNLSDIFRDFAVSFWGVALFTSLAITYVFGQYFLLNIVKEKNREQEIRRTHFKMLEKTVTVIQYLLIAIMVSVVLQIIFALEYYTMTLNIAVTISAGLAVYILGLLAYWFLSWFVTTRALIVLLFGLAMAASTISIIGMTILFNTILLDKQAIISPQSDVTFFLTSSWATFIDSWANPLQTISGVAAFILFWGGIVVLLHHNMYRIGRIKFWVLSSTPLIIFSTIYLSLYQVLAESLPTDDALGTIVVPVLFIIYTGIAAAILIGLAFSSVAKALSHKTPMKDYLMISSYGFILFFVTTLTSIAGGGYPPFGVVNVLLVGPLSFLILTGLYRSAVSVAQDAKLRHSVRDRTKKELEFLYDIGSAETYKEVEVKVMTVIKENRDAFAQESGIEPSLTDNEIQDLMGNVEKELENTIRRNKEI